MKRAILVSLFLGIALLARGQQRPMFTQYMFNMQVINPAYSAADEAFTLTLAHRQQWTGFEGAPNTQTLTLHTPIRESNTSVGLIVSRDQVGEVLNDRGIWASVAQRVPVGESSWLAAGISGGFSKFSADYSLLADPTSAADPYFQSESNANLNLGWGVMLFADQYYLGLSSPFFVRQTLRSSAPFPTSESKHFLFTAGYVFTVSEFLRIKPNGLLKYVKGSPLEADLNANFLVADRVWLGASWRSFDSVDFLAQLQIGNNLQLGYSYDMTSTDLRTAQRGTHEFVLKMRFPVKGRGFPRCFF
jgi:type IX secretion system PorP/SprF family membrane protein